MAEPMARTRIFQTRRWPEQAETALDELGKVTRPDPDRPLTKEQLREGLSNCEVFCPTVSDTIGADVVSGLDLSGKLIANYGAGTNHIDVKAAIASGAVVSNTPDVLTDATAEIALLLMLAVARRAGEGERQLRDGAWPGWHPMHMLGTILTGKRLGLVGFGRIGQAVARRAHHGFGMEVLVWNRSAVPRGILDETGAAQISGLEELLGKADFVSLHVPGGSDTHHLLDSRRLSCMKPGAFVINTARGSVIDEGALARALENRVIAGAGLDVFEREPQVNEALLDREDVVLLPHLGSATRETRTEMGLRVVENVALWLDGGVLRDPVT